MKSEKYLNTQNIPVYSATNHKLKELKEAYQTKNMVDLMKLLVDKEHKQLLTNSELFQMKAERDKLTEQIQSKLNQIKNNINE